MKFLPHLWFLRPSSLSHSLALLPIFCVSSKESLCIYKHICVSAHTWTHSTHAVLLLTFSHNSTYKSPLWASTLKSGSFNGCRCSGLLLMDKVFSFHCKQCCSEYPWLSVFAHMVCVILVLLIFQLLLKDFGVTNRSKHVHLNFWWILLNRPPKSVPIYLLPIMFRFPTNRQRIMMKHVAICH